MKRLFLAFTIFTLATSGARAAELVFDFAGTPAGGVPKGFRSFLGGTGEAGKWEVQLVEVPSLFAPLTPLATSNNRQAVLTHVSHDQTDERFPMLVYEDEVLGDFTFTTKFKLVSGEKEQMAGVAFRWQDARNYCYVRASGLSGTINFYEVVDGARRPPVGNKAEVSSNAWHELTVENIGSQVRVLFNGKEVVPPLQTTVFPLGKVGFWTKSDSLTYFFAARLNFKPRIILAQKLVEETLRKYPRIVEMTIAAPTNSGSPPMIIASLKADEVGRIAPTATADVIANRRVYYGKDNGTVAITLPLRDCNGEPAAAVRLVLKSFSGQTEKNAIARATPIVKSLEPRIQRAADLLQ